MTPPQDAAASDFDAEDKLTDEQLVAQELERLEAEDKAAARQRRTYRVEQLKAAAVAVPAALRNPKFTLGAALVLLLARPLLWLLIEPLYLARVEPLVLWWTDVILYVIAGALLILTLVGRAQARQAEGASTFDPFGLIAGLVVLLIPLSYHLVRLFVPLMPHYGSFGSLARPGEQAFSFLAELLAPIYGSEGWLVAIVILWLGLAIGLVVLGVVTGRVRLSAPTNDQTNSLAIAALVTVFFSTLAGIVLGHVALTQIRRDGTRGAGLATAALWLGYGSIALTVLAVVAVLLLGASWRI